MDLISQNYGDLSPPKVRRSYCCDLCGLLTSNPREYLYHQRDIHNMRLNVFECKLCIYASKHVQKLQRHYGLVHRQKMPLDESFPPTLPKPSKVNKMSSKSQFQNRNSAFLNNLNPAAEYEFPLDEYQTSAPQRNFPKYMNAAGNVFKCSTCDYQTKKKFLLTHHEKTAHLKKRFYRCAQCGYVTNDKAQYTKHVKYHSLPKVQCEFCHFKSAYKWNMDRHMKNHVLTDGGYSCSLCSFITHTKQSLKMHVANHHQGGNVIDVEEDSFPEQFGDSNESEWMNSSPPDVEEPSSSFGYQGMNTQNTFSATPNRSNMMWNQEETAQHKCKFCNFQTKWSFELQRHEETHKSLKRHSCPLCGMRFEHIAWLTKHLTRIHKEDDDAKSLAAAYELMKPTRRRATKPAVRKNVHSAKTMSFGQNYLNNDNTIPEKQSVLSSLLQNSSPAKFLSMLPKVDLTNKFEMDMNEPTIQPEVEEYFEQDVEVPAAKRPAPKKPPTCRICGYRTKWISEMEKHMRVHSDAKPFQCSRCNYHSKWKGDLTRHMMKNHGVKIYFSSSSKKTPVPKIKLRKSLPNRSFAANRWQTVAEETAASLTIPSSSAAGRADSPLDLTTARTDIFQPMQQLSDTACEYQNEDAAANDFLIDVESGDSEDKELDGFETAPSQAQNDIQDEPEVIVSPGKKKYHCPFCNFITSTPSRFHVHVVQHYNRKPFMCSFCGHRSNWEWDITKHIRLRGSKDKEHNKACVLLTDESGRRNYEKYDKYLKEEIIKPKPPKVVKPREFSRKRALRNMRQEAEQETTPVSVSKRAPQVDDAPVNIVVTPDIPFGDNAQSDEVNYRTDLNNVENNRGKPSNDFKFYQCKHCNYKHSSRKVVISHLSVHAGIKPFRCKVCGLTANWRHIIVRHVKVAHNGYMNDVEDRITYTQEGFVIRITSVKGSGKTADFTPANKNAHYTCKFCPYKCDKEVYIKFHMKQHKPRDGAIYQCTSCPYYVKFKKTLIRHMQLHDPPPNNFTENSEPNELSQENEMLMPETEKNNSVIELNDYLIGNGSNQNGYLGDDSIVVNYNQPKAADKRSPVKFKRHVCENCPYRTDNRTQFLYHKQFHRPNNAAPFKCTVCSYWATMQHILTQHMRVHDQSSDSNSSPENTIPFTEIPQESMKTSQTIPDDIPLVLVQRDGVVSKMFKCRFCPMMNKKRANVRVHERMHGASQSFGKYTCSLCNYKCLGQGSLTNHMKIHQNQGSDMNGFQQEQNNSMQTAENNGAVRKKVFSYFCMRCPAVFKSSSDLHIHRSFHGANLPYPCPQCDYRAKHKPHLQKHLQVHTLAYISKRDASFGPPVNPEADNAIEFLNDPHDPIPINKQVEQMLLLEVAEVKTFLKKGADYAQKKMHKCPLCPAYFTKTTVLAYHCSLHGSSAEFACPHCDYATVRQMNLSVHVQIHGKPEITSKRPVRVMQCKKCPATFNKMDRYERHFNLHGKDYRYTCDKCDYSVRFAANLSKHRIVHMNVSKENDENIIICTPEEFTSTKAINLPKVSSDDANFKHPEIEEKKMYTCDRCPYYQARKDAVQSHQNRHTQKGGYQCPYCDYRSMGSSFLRDHVKSHIQPNNLTPPQAYMRHQNFKIWIVDGESKQLLFEDKGDNLILNKRFFPSLEGREHLVAIKERDKQTNEAELEEENEEVLRNAFNPPAKVSEKSIKLNEYAVAQDMQPQVVLKDIFMTGKVKKLQNGSVLLNSTSFQENDDSVSERSKKQNASEGQTEKPSLIMKIKVENIIEDNNERSLYTISTKDNLQNASDSASDVTIPADDIEDLGTICDSTTNVENTDEVPNVAENADNVHNEAEMADEVHDDAEMADEVHDDAEMADEVHNETENNAVDMVISESEPKNISTNDDFSTTTIKTEIIDENDDDDVQNTGTDFLKELDIMVNSVPVNSV